MAPNWEEIGNEFKETANGKGESSEFKESANREMERPNSNGASERSNEIIEKEILVTVFRLSANIAVRQPRVQQPLLDF